MSPSPYTFPFISQWNNDSSPALIFSGKCDVKSCQGKKLQMEQGFLTSNTGRSTDGMTGSPFMSLILIYISSHTS
jgi:hypothetical protein